MPSKINKATKAKSIHPYCIVRCRNAGVHAGFVVARKGGVLTLRDSRRLWKWTSRATLSELSQSGPITTSNDGNRYGCPLPTLHLTESDVCEVIPCSAMAQKAIREIPEWVAK